VWYVTANGIGRITPQVAVTQFASSPNITARTVGPDGHVWFYKEGQLVRVMAPGLATAILIPETFAGGSVSSLATGSDHNLWFALTTGVIVRMTLGGQFTGFALPQGMAFPHVMVRGADGNLWFGVGIEGSWIGRITPQGRVTRFSACPA
jgi:streptogramin lyase